jgi:hypothetical protein
LLRIGAGRQSAQRFLWSLVVVFPVPGLDDDAGVQQVARLTTAAGNGLQARALLRDHEGSVSAQWLRFWAISHPGCNGTNAVLQTVQRKATTLGNTNQSVYVSKKLTTRYV